MRGRSGQNGRGERSAARTPRTRPMTTAPALTSLASAIQISASEQRQQRVRQEAARSWRHASASCDAAAEHGLDVERRREQLARGRVHGGHGRAGEEREQDRRRRPAPPSRTRPAASPLGPSGCGLGPRSASHFQNTTLPARAKPIMASRLPTSTTAQSQAQAGLAAQRLQDQQLADEARERRQADRGDGGEEEQPGQEVELGEARCRHQPVAGAAAAAGDEVGQQEQRGTGERAVRPGSRARPRSPSR